MGTRNYSLSRQMTKAGRIALNDACKKGDLSFSSVDSIGQRWTSFCEYAKKHDINRMEKITRDFVIQYGKELAAKIQAGELTTSTAQNAVSAVNTVLKIVPASWKTVSPVHDCGIGQRTNVRSVAPTKNDAYLDAKQALSDRPRESALVSLCRELGLRSKEGSLLNARKAYTEAIRTRAISITLGTKGGRPRTIPITSTAQLDALKTAAAVQGRGKSIMPPDKNWRQWREGGLRHARETVGGLHELRAAYACDRYKQLTGFDSPAVAGHREAGKADDYHAREVLSAELGHGRTDVLVSYVGSSK